jgi:hypothetical protein
MAARRHLQSVALFGQLRRMCVDCCRIPPEIAFTSLETLAKNNQRLR